ncbi:hypothetical protein E2C01_007187 [Portunus trituberculatus]|uniref:Uncharacterized protein n=1 Tax=Portunus trituberculatus TaxID=210409 RepID=A0A5B7CYA3_PORTR|nr:hypothetical protein [Portunus trituberculatus]
METVRNDYLMHNYNCTIKLYTICEVHFYSKRDSFSSFFSPSKISHKSQETITWKNPRGRQVRCSLHLSFEVDEMLPLTKANNGFSVTVLHLTLVVSMAWLHKNNWEACH